jgi:hypothetical protein
MMPGGEPSSFRYCFTYDGDDRREINKEGRGKRAAGGKLVEIITDFFKLGHGRK